LAQQKDMSNSSLSHQTSETDHITIKRYSGPGIIQRWQTEMRLLQALQNQFPLPTLLEQSHEAEIHIRTLAGVPAADLITAENSPLIMAALGHALQKLQSTPLQEMHNFLHGTGDILVHGDYCLPNFIFISQPLTLEAIIEWEWAHLGDAVEDPSWMEWHIRMHMGKFVRDLPIFYEAYGITPGWGERKDAMIMQVHRHLEFARMAGEKRAIQKWQNRLQITSRYQAS